MLSSSSLSKIKRYLPIMVGGKERKRIQLSPLFRKQHATLKHDTFIHLGWEILCLTFNQISLKVFIRFLDIRFGSIVTKPSAVSLCVQEDSLNKPFICKISVIHFDHPWVSPCQYISSKLDLWFRVVGLPTTDHFISTTALYLGSWSRNRQYLEICMPQWQVSHLRRQVASLMYD